MVLSFTRVLNGVAAREGDTPAGEVVNLRLGQLRAIDIGDSELDISYSLSGETSHFSIDQKFGTLFYLSGFDAELGDGILSVVVTAHAVSPDINGITPDPISHLITYTALNANDEAATWLSNPMGMDIDEANNAMGATIGTGVATFVATDTDGAGISYWLSDYVAGDRGGAGEGTYFLRISEEGVVSFYREGNYEVLADYRAGLISRGRASFDDLANLTIVVNARGTAGGRPAGDGAVVITQLFVLTLNEVAESGVNDEPTIWSSTQPTGAIFDEFQDASTGAFAGRLVETFTALDNDGAGISYWLARIPEDRFDAGRFFLTIDDAGVMSLYRNLNHEEVKDFFTARRVNYDASRYTVIVNAEGTADGARVGFGRSVVSQLFILTVNNVAENEINDEATIWRGAQLVGTALDEFDARQGATAGAYVGLTIATFTATDAEGAGLSYWLSDYVGAGNAGRGEGTYFMTINGNGELSLYREGDYDLLANYRNGLTARSRGRTSFDDLGNLTIVVNAVGTAGGPATGDGAVPVTQLFILTLNNLNDDAINDLPTTWDGAQSSTIQLDEWTGAEDINGELGARADLALATFTPLDGDGDNFSYWLVRDPQDRVGAATYFMTIDEGGVLRLIRNLDYEFVADFFNSRRLDFDSHGYTVIVNAVGTSGTRVANSVGNIIITQLFVLSINDVNEGSVNDRTAGWDSSLVSGTAVSESHLLNPNSGRMVGAVRGEAIYTFAPTDPDGSDRFSFFVNDRPGEIGGVYAMSIDQDGVLRFARNMDYDTIRDVVLGGRLGPERWGRYSVVVNAIGLDGGTPTGEGIGVISTLFILTLTNVDDVPLRFVANNVPRGGTFNEDDSVANVFVANFSATDLDGVAVSYSLAGDDAAYYSISQDGRLSFNSRFDYEKSTDGDGRFEVVVRAHSTDSGSTEVISALYVLQARNVNDERASWAVSPTSGADIDEFHISGGDVAGAFRNAPIATFSATDPDGGDIVYGVANAPRETLATVAMSIDANGVLRSSLDIDFEILNGRNLFTAIIFASSAGRATIADSYATQLFILTINDVNDNEINLRFNGGVPDVRTITANESDALTAAVVFRYSVTNDDANGGVSYELRGADSAYFSIDDNGVLSFISSVDADVQSSYSVEVRAHSDQDDDFIRTAYVINLNNLNDEATSWSGTQSMGGAIDEGVNGVGGIIGTEIATFAAADADGNQFSYWLTDYVAGDRGGAGEGSYFMRINANGVLSLYRNADYELLADYRTITNTRASYDDIANLTITVHARGASGGRGRGDGATDVTQLFILTLNNVDEEVRFIRRNIGGYSLNEIDDFYTGSIAVMVATDLDGTAVSYSLGGDGDYFSFNADNGNLYFISSLDYDLSPRGDGIFSVVVYAHSTVLAGQTATTDLVIRLYDLNDEAAAWAVSPIATHTVSLRGAVNMMARGSALASIIAVDPDGPGISYWLSDSVDSGGDVALTIDQQGIVRAARDVSFGELSTYWQNQGSNPNDIERFLNYSLVVFARGINQGEAGNPRLYRDAGTVISQLIHIEFEVDPIDYGHVWSQDLSINENVSAMDVFETFVAVPLRGTVDYRLEGTDTNYFSIDQSGNLYVLSVFDFENTNRNQLYSITVIASNVFNGVTEEISEDVVLSIVNVNDNPTVWSGTQPANGAVNENRAVGGGIGIATFNATDADGVAISYWLTGGDNFYFTLNNENNDGAVYLISQFDYETDRHLYTFIINAVGVAGVAGGHSGTTVSQQFVLTINGLDDNAVAFVAGTPVSGGRNFDEDDALASRNLGRYLGIDADIDVNNNNIAVSYSLSGRNANYFSLDANNNLILISSLDYEDRPNSDNEYRVNINVHSTERAGEVAVRTLTIFVNNLNDETTNWAPNQPTNGAVNENRAVGSGIGIATFNATDADGVAISYWLTGGDNSYFTLNNENNDGAVYLISQFDYETDRHLYTFVINALGTDGDSNSQTNIFISQQFVLTINGLDDNRVAFDAGTSANIVLNFNENDGLNDILIGRYVGSDNDIDVNNNNIAVSYSLSGRNAGYFTLDSNGNLHVNRALDYENRPSNDNEYRVVVRLHSIETAGEVETRTVTIRLTNLNDENSVWVSNPSSITIEEYNSHTGTGLTGGQVLGQFVATDPDGAGMEYSLAGSGGDNVYFRLSTANDRATLYANTAFDFEDRSLFTITINARGTAGGNPVGIDGFITQAVVITITDVVDTGTASWSSTQVAQPFSATYSENSFDQVYTGSNPGPDRIKFFRADLTAGVGVSLSYWLSDTVAGSDDKNFFTFVPSDNGIAGRLWFASSPNYEDIGSNRNLTITVNAAVVNAGGAFGDVITSLVTISIVNVAESGNNEAPSQWGNIFNPAETYGITINEGLTGQINGIFRDGRYEDAFFFYDADGSGASYWLGNTADAQFFSIDNPVGHNGVLYLRDTADFETKNLYTLVVMAQGTAGGTPTAAAGDPISLSVVITVNDLPGLDDPNSPDNGFAFTRDVADNNVDLSQAGVDHINLSAIAGSLEIASFTGDDYTINDLASLELSFDNGQGDHHWWFVIADDATDSGYLFFDADGDLSTDNDVVLLFNGDNSVLDSGETDFSDDFTAPTNLDESGALSFDQFLALLNIQAGDISFV